jgi:hypothetical protein
MPLVTTQLFSASVPSAQDTVTAIIQLATAYNVAEKDFYGDEELRVQAKRLDAIMAHVGSWLTARRHPADESTCVAAMEEMCEQCSGELNGLGIRSLGSRWSDSDTNVRNYWLERLDPKHRPGHALKPYYLDFKAGKQAASQKGDDFWAYADARGVGYEVNYLKEPTAGALRKSELKAERAKRLVTIQSGVLHREQKVYATVNAAVKTEVMGAGCAMFVWDLKGRIYSDGQILNRFHHSSFRGGGPVKCAGELRTDEGGKLTMLTAKTGHYTTTAKEFKSFLAFLEQQHALTEGTCCIPDAGGSQLWPVYRAKQWLQHGNSAPKLDAGATANALNLTPAVNKPLLLKIGAPV